jgi:hypothetical protein
MPVLQIKTIRPLKNKIKNNIVFVIVYNFRSLLQSSHSEKKTMRPIPLKKKINGKHLNS